MQETKGQATKNHILQQGLMLASVRGLVNISIGGLAEKAGMSRSGLFAHFLSKEQLQLEILEYAGRLLDHLVFAPSREIKSPAERLAYLQVNLPNWYDKSEPSIPGGCIFFTATLEFDDRPGKIKDNLLSQQIGFLEILKNTYDEAVEKNEFIGNSSRERFAFSFYSFYMGYHQYKKFFGDDDATRLYDFSMSQLMKYCQGHRIGEA